MAAFNRIAQYDGAISDSLSSVQFEDEKLSEDYVPERAPLQIGFSHYDVGVSAAHY